MKAIKTRFHGPGNVRGSRVSATDEDGNRVVISWNHSLNAVDNHRSAAAALLTKMNWGGELITGSLRDCYVHVFKE